MMNQTITYKTLVFSFLLLFLFSHVGFAAVEYLCNMGMETQTSVCTNCHPDPAPRANQTTVTTASDFKCCEVIISNTGTVDNYIMNMSDPVFLIAAQLVPAAIVVKPGENSLFQTSSTEIHLQPIFELHGISTAIQFSSFIR